MNIDRNEFIGIHKAYLWEEAKGKLRAMYAVNGQTRSTEPRTPDWQTVKKEIEQFIEHFEAHGFHE